MMTPVRIAETGFVVVDATWGTICPLTLAHGVVTVAELEVIEQLERGLPVVDTRPAPAYARSTIPGARNILHDWQTLGLPVKPGSAESEASDAHQPRATRDRKAPSPRIHCAAE